jgi:hypothetical protein
VLGLKLLIVAASACAALAVGLGAGAEPRGELPGLSAALR